MKTISAGTAGSGNAVLSVTVGGTALTCSGNAGVKLNTSTTPQSYVFSSESELTGEIVITIANEANKAIYLKEIHINQ